MPLLLILRSALVATANGLTLLGISPPHVASSKEGDRLIEDSTSPERLLARDRTLWTERLVVFGLTVYEIWSLRRGHAKIGGWPARLGEIGALVTIAGATLRLRCYQVLGRFFTFKVAIRKQHRLITGAFPYNVFRHPSYTGLVLMQLGLAIRCGTSASSLHYLHVHRLAAHMAQTSSNFLFSALHIHLEPGTIQTLGTGGVALVLIAGQMKLLNARVRVEEKALREEFGEEYERYCEGTWKFLPGW